MLFCACLHCCQAPQFSPPEFLDILRNGPVLNDSSFAYARFGGKVKASPCPRLQRDAAMDYLPGDGKGSAGPSIWIGSAGTVELGCSAQSEAHAEPHTCSLIIGVVSAAHFDLFDNLFSVAAGAKHLFLAPPTAANLLSFSPYPGTHPHARQAQVREHWLQIMKTKVWILGVFVRGFLAR